MSDTRRPRILIVTRNLPPLIGGMERLNWHMADELSRRAEVRVIGPEGATELAPKRVEISEIPLHPLWKFLASAQVRVLRDACRWRPDVIFAGSGLTALPALLAARAAHARAVVYVHGLDLIVQHPIYRRLWWPAVRRMDRVIANSRATRTLAEQIGVDPAHIGIVHPGVEIPTAPATAETIARFRAQNDLRARPLLLSVGRLSARKGLREFVMRSLPTIVAARPNVLLLIVGDTPRDALHAQAQTPQSILAAARLSGVENNVRFFGPISDYKLGLVYQAADVHVFPVREIANDPEGFGMVAMEAAAHGLPTVAFATGGVADAVADGVSGKLVAPGDYAAFASAVLHFLELRNALETSCIGYAQRFLWPVFGSQLAEQLAHVVPSLSVNANLA